MDPPSPRCPNPDCPPEALRRRASILVISPDLASAPTPWITSLGYWAGVAGGALLSFGVLVLVYRWAASLGPEDGVAYVLGWVLVLALLLAGLLGLAHHARYLWKHVIRGTRARRYHYACARCGYHWEQVDFRPDLAVQEAARLRSSLATWRRLRARTPIGSTLLRLAFALRYTADWRLTPPLLEECLALLDPERDRARRAYALAGLGYANLGEGDWPRARLYFEQALDAARAGPDWVGIDLALRGLGTALLGQGEVSAARAALAESLELARRLGDRPGVVWDLEGLAGTLAEDHPLAAARLFGAAEAFRESLGVPRPRDGLRVYHQTLATLGSRLEADALARAWAEGRALSLVDAVALVAQAAPRSRSTRA